MSHHVLSIFQPFSVFMELKQRRLGKVKFASIKGDPGILHVDQTLGKNENHKLQRYYSIGMIDPRDITVRYIYI